MEEKLYTQSDLNAILTELLTQSRYLQEKTINLALSLDRANRLIQELQTKTEPKNE